MILSGWVIAVAPMWLAELVAADLELPRDFSVVQGEGSMTGIFADDFESGDPSALSSVGGGT